jgi:putative ABC transport system ATP-binding protein
MVNGTDALRLTEKQKTGFRLKNIGYIFQDYALIPTLTALENVVLPLLMAGVPRSEANVIAVKTLASVGLEGRGKHLPNELSGGQQQRVSIARAISHNPALILADEPTANLDNESSLRIMGIFKTLRDRGITVVMITHENEYAKMTGRIITLFDGVIEKEERN